MIARSLSMINRLWRAETMLFLLAMKLSRSKFKIQIRITKS